MSHKSIYEQEVKHGVKSKTYEIVGKIIETNSSLWYSHFRELLELLYLKESPLLKIVYEYLPLMLRLCIEAKESKNNGKSRCIQEYKPWQRSFSPTSSTTIIVASKIKKKSEITHSSRIYTPSISTAILKGLLIKKEE